MHSSAPVDGPEPPRRHDHDGSAGEGAQIRWPVLVGSGLIVTVIAGWALAAPTQAAHVLGAGVAWIAQWLGWFSIALATAILVFVVYLGIRFSRVRLGSDTSRPDFSTFSWASMLFAAGIGTDIMFFAVAEPVTHYLAPPHGGGPSLMAAREATVWTLFHYGITGWAMYALMGIALGYFSHRRGLPLAVRSALYPLVGRRVDGPIGHGVDIATVLGTIFGIATSLGIGVVMLNVGLDMLFGIPQGLPARIGLAGLAVLVATVSATTGIDRGIRLLSQLNVVLAVALSAFVLVTGDAAFVLRAIVMNVGDFVALFPSMTLDTMAYDYSVSWMGTWTLFFWAWWIAWASFVGMFLARISKGRTIGQFVVGTLTIPFSYVVMWVSVFGNTAVKRIVDGDSAFGRLARDVPELGFYTLLKGFPLAGALIGIATFVGLLFYVTSADSGALVMANLCSKLPTSDVDARPWLRTTWALACGVVTLAMLVVNGIPALQNATVIMGLPFSVVLILVMVGLHRALTRERVRERAVEATLTVPASEPGAWRRRLARQLTGQTPRRAALRLDTVVIPALEAVAAELREQDVEARVDVETAPTGIREGARLSVSAPGVEDFHYPVALRVVPLPSYGARMLEANDTTTRLDVLVGAVEYDISDYTSDQICHDVLDHYGRWRERVLP